MKRSAEITTSPVRAKGKAPNAHLLPTTRIAALPSREEHSKLSLDKHTGSLRYSAAYAASLLAEDIIRVFRYTGKKDKEYLKGLVWSFGVLFDKATSGTSTDAIVLRIPARLLENVKAVIAIQAGKKAKVQESVSSSSVVDTTGYVIPVADTVAGDAALPLDSAPSSVRDDIASSLRDDDQDRGTPLRPTVGGAATGT